MREIKFRSWIKAKSKLIYDFGLMHNNKISEDDEIVLMQYTGLKDKNGKEIYEGDIIEGGYLNPLTEEFTSKKYIVEYANASYMGKLIGHSPYGDTWLNFIQGEVIGNMYENTELISI